MPETTDFANLMSSHTKLVEATVRDLLTRHNLRGHTASVANSVWLEVWQRGYEDGQGLSSLLRVLVHNKIVDRIRDLVRRHRITGPQVQFDDLEQAAQGAADPAEQAAKTELMQNALAALGEDLRPLAILYLEGSTQDEIAAQSGLTIDMVRNRLDRIRAIWKKLYAEVHS